ncbi:MAG TPA: 30S ribosomal protein S18 [Bdellovibrionota bacterium]|nr:30S ribosomal protein S18 [Bdellovibrionota bacterium]
MFRERKESSSHYGDMGDGKDFGGRGGGKSFGRRKGCRFCNDAEIKLDFKDPLLLAAFVSEKGRILPRRMTGNCSLHQRAVSRAVKRARYLALLSFTEGFHAGSSEGATP